MQYAVSHVPHVHLPVPTTSQKVFVYVGKGLVALGAVHVHTSVSKVTFVGGAYHIIKYIILIRHHYLLDFCTHIMQHYALQIHFTLLSVSSAVKLMPGLGGHAGVDFKESLKHQGFSPQFSFT